jgi:hypothetical protein
MSSNPLRKSLDMALSTSLAHRVGWQARAGAHKPTKEIPKRDGGKRLIHVFGDKTEVGQDAEVVAKVLKPILEREAIRRFANGGVIWSPKSSVWLCMEAHAENPEKNTLSADIKSAFWQVRQSVVYRLLRQIGLGQHMAALISRQMCDDIPGHPGKRLLMGHPLAPVTLAIWVATFARKAHRFLRLLGAEITWYVDNVTVSWRKRKPTEEEVSRAASQSGFTLNIPPGGLELNPGTLMAAFARTPIVFKRHKTSNRAWSSWTGRELGLVRIRHKPRHVRVQPHRRSDGIRKATKATLQAMAYIQNLPTISWSVPIKALRIALGRLNWYTMTSPLFRVNIKARNASRNRGGAVNVPVRVAGGALQPKGAGT